MDYGDYYWGLYRATIGITRQALDLLWAIRVPRDSNILI